MITEHDPNGRHYVMGVFYFNREDKRLFVPRRLGFGTTFNFARPSAWIVIGVLLGVIYVRAYLRN